MIDRNIVPKDEIFEEPAMESETYRFAGRLQGTEDIYVYALPNYNNLGLID